MENSKFFVYTTETIPKSRSVTKARGRFTRLSKPKIRVGDEDLVGPGSYDPTDSYLSTKSKSPRPIMCRSNRFMAQKLPPLYLIDRKGANDDPDSPSKPALSSSPSFSFKRTGHNLKLVENPSFPGAGQYSPTIESNEKLCSFAKAPREFSWKKVSIDKTKFKLFDNYF